MVGLSGTSIAATHLRIILTVEPFPSSLNLRLSKGSDPGSPKLHGRRPAPRGVVHDCKLSGHVLRVLAYELQLPDYGENGQETQRSSLHDRHLRCVSRLRQRVPRLLAEHEGGFRRRK